MMTRTVSVIDGTSVTVASNGEAPKLVRLEGYCNGTANTQYWLQLFNAMPSDTDVPLRAVQVVGGFGFTFDYTSQGGLSCASLPGWNASTNGLVIVLSTTEATYTAPVSETATINVDIEEYALELYGTTTVGDTTTNVAKRTILADASTNTELLVALTVKETGGNASFIQLFGKDPAVNDVALRVIPIAANETKVLKFGSTGSGFVQQAADGTLYRGIYVGLSQTASSYDGTGQGTIKGVYK